MQARSSAEELRARLLDAAFLHEDPASYRAGVEAVFAALAQRARERREPAQRAAS